MQEDFSDTNLLILIGRSGSGKSTMMQHLAAHHPAYQHLCHKTCMPEQNDKPAQAELLLIDETRSFRDLLWFMKHKRKDQKTIMASHWPKWAVYLLARLHNGHVYEMDQDAQKITHALDKRNMQYSPQTIAEFMQLYQGSYYDLQLIIETQPNERDFDKVWRIFKAQYQIKHMPEKICV